MKRQYRKKYRILDPDEGLLKGDEKKAPNGFWYPVVSIFPIHMVVQDMDTIYRRKIFY